MRQLRTRRFWAWLAVVLAGQFVVLAVLAALLVFASPVDERAALRAAMRSAAPVLVYGALLVGVAWGAVVHWMLERYPVALRRLTAEARVLLALESPHSMTRPPGAAELDELADVINRLADRSRRVEAEHAARSAEESAGLREERDRFAALLSQLVEGVIVCNTQGRVLLFNARAQELLAGPVATASTHAPLGLGRSIFSLLDREEIAHAMEQTRVRFEHEAGRPQTRFMTAAPSDRPLRVRVAPFVSGAGAVAGMVFTLDAADKTEPPKDRAIAPEVIRAADLLVIARARLVALPGLRIDVDDPPPDLWLRVDSFVLVQALVALVERVSNDYTISRFRLRACRSGQLVALDVAWDGTVMGHDVLLAWQDETLYASGRPVRVTLRQLVEQHGGQLAYQADRPKQEAWIRLSLPACEPTAPAALPSVEASRPEFYDFELFENRDLGDLAQRTLASLAYTVFDTETTGLQPSAGDEIISIGAVRIVNGRLLRRDVYEQLVDPCRPIDPASVRVHGIDAAALAGQPTIDKVLPRFFAFCEDTVLVGHNAAFDMRFLALKEKATGIRFDHPVLDTLLLSAIVFPSHESHDLEPLAARLGVQVIGRHTALGDALVTGEVFLRLLPMLAAQGVVSLGDALEASRATRLERLQY
jgi:DNA polymerase III epsilon subunit family exonuclease